MLHSSSSVIKLGSLVYCRCTSTTHISFSELFTSSIWSDLSIWGHISKSSMVFYKTNWSDARQDKCSVVRLSDKTPVRPRPRRAEASSVIETIYYITPHHTKSLWRCTLKADIFYMIIIINYQVLFLVVLWCIDLKIGREVCSSTKQDHPHLVLLLFEPGWF